jgi:hypothetical protein
VIGCHYTRHCSSALLSHPAQRRSAANLLFGSAFLLQHWSHESALAPTKTVKTINIEIQQDFTLDEGRNLGNPVMSPFAANNLHCARALEPTCESIAFL